MQGKRPISSFDYYAAAIMAMFILFAAAQGGRTLLEEKQNITFQRMVIAGTPRAVILAGKFFTIFILVLLQVAVMTAYSTIILKVNWGNTGLVALTSLCSAFAIAGIGTVIAAATYKADNDKMANVFETAVIQTMALLGGSFFPVDIMPSFMRKFSVLSLNGISLKSYLSVMMGYDIEEIAHYLASLIILGAVFVVLAVYIFNGRGGDKYVKYNQTKTIKAA